MKAKYNGLKVPPGALKQVDSMEILRAWEVDGALHCSIRPDIWEDPGAWGIVLADIARQVAAALEEEGVGKGEEVLAQIVEQFTKEVAAAVPLPHGTFLDD